MADTDMPAGGSPDKPEISPRDILNDISLEADRALTMLDMAGEKINAIHAEIGAADGVWLYAQQALKGHLDKIEELAESGHELVVKLQERRS